MLALIVIGVSLQGAVMHVFVHPEPAAVYSVMSEDAFGVLLLRARGLDIDQRRASPDSLATKAEFGFVRESVSVQRVNANRGPIRLVLKLEPSGTPFVETWQAAAAQDSIKVAVLLLCGGHCSRRYEVWVRRFQHGFVAGKPRLVAIG